MWSSRRNWTQEEDRVLYGIVCSVGQSDWPTVARMFQQQCPCSKWGKRTGKQCRQRWHNHLNPKIKKEPWTQQEEQKLFEVQKTYGNKWKEISFHLPGRTDNDIKNKFYSTLRRSLRRLNKVIGGKNSTGQIREIKPSVLSTIISFIYANDHIPGENLSALKQLPELIFKFSNYKPIRQNIHEAVCDAGRDKISMIFDLIDQFNLVYGEMSDNCDQSDIQDKYHKNQEDLEEQNQFIDTANNLERGRLKIEKNLSLKIFNFGIVEIENSFFQAKPNEDLLGEFTEMGPYQVNSIARFQQIKNSEHMGIPKL